MNIDVTDKVIIGNPDDEFLPLGKCVCGAEFCVWQVSISIYPDSANECPACGRKFFFKNSITVYQVIEDKKENDENDESEHKAN